MEVVETTTIAVEGSSRWLPRSYLFGRSFIADSSDCYLIHHYTARSLLNLHHLLRN